MIVTRIGRYAALLHVALALASPELLLGAAGLKGEEGGGARNRFHRRLACADATKKNQCDAPCVWDAGSCQDAPATAPPTAGPTAPPTTDQVR